MAKYIAKRIGLAVVTCWLVATLTFFLMNLVPGGPFMACLLYTSKFLMKEKNITVRHRMFLRQEWQLSQKNLYICLMVKKK